MGANLCGGFSTEESEEISISSQGLQNINDASVEELLTVPGIGRIRAEKIVAYREENGPFECTEDLAQVPGIGPTLASNLAVHMDGFVGDVVEPVDEPDERGCCGCCAYEGPWFPTGFCCRKSEEEEALFFPDDEKRTGLKKILKLLGSAKETLDVAVFTICHEALAQALLEAHQRGVRVRIITDDMQAKQEKSYARMLQQAAVPLRMDSNEKMHMHHKFVVVDKSTVMSGSLNWTHPALERGNENVVISTRKTLAEDFRHEFNRMWKFFKGQGHPDAAAGFFINKVAALFFPEATKSHNAQLIKGELEQATESIDIAVFTLTLDSLVDVLIKKHKEGLQVRVITDNRQANVPGADAARLRQAGVEVRVDRSWYAMHHKFAVIDEQTLINGSFNWTAQAANGNQENAVIYRDHYALAEAFSAEFEKLWDEYA